MARLVPPRVTADGVVDFDFYRPCAPGGDPFLARARLHDGPGVVWTPHSDGHWIVTRGEGVKTIPFD